MAKKKRSHANQEKASEKPVDSLKPAAEKPPSMDSEALEKFDSLKSLNQIILKEMVERRQQVDLLVQATGSLESEKEALGSELTRMSEKAASLELEKTVVDVFVAVQVGEEFEQKMKGLEMENREMKLGISEKESEIGRLNIKVSEIADELTHARNVTRSVCVERDYFADKLERRTVENRGLKHHLFEFGEIDREITELRGSYNAVIVEKEDMENRVKSLMGEKEDAQRGLVEAYMLIESLNEQFSGILKEKEGIEEEKKVERIKNQELENALSGVKEIVADLQKEEAKLRKTLSEFEKKFAEDERRHKDMEREIGELVEDKKFDKWVTQCLEIEKNAYEKELSELLKEVDEQKEKIQELANEKNGIIGELQNEVGELKGAVLKLEEGNRVGFEKINSLESEIEGRQKDMGREIGELVEDKKFDKWVIQCLENEKNAIGNELSESLKELDEQKEKIQELAHEKNGIIGELQNKVGELKDVVLKLEEGNRVSLKKIKSLESEVGVLEQASVEKERCLNAKIGEVARLKEKTTELESKIRESSKMLEQVKADRGQLFDEKKEAERQCKMLKMEIASLEKAITEGREECKSMKEKVELANAKSELVLKMVKGTAVFCSKEECEDEDGEFAGDETKEYAQELKTIKEAFKKKDGKVEEMKKEMEGIEKDAKKKKSFWKMVSSATTLLAAASVAYVARGGSNHSSSSILV